MDSFLDKYQVTKLNYDTINNINSPIAPKIEGDNDRLPSRKTQEQVGLAFYQIFKEDMLPIVFKLFYKIETEGTLPISFY